MIATRLTLICHASTGATRESVFPQDEPLDEQGLRKARAMANLVGSYDQACRGPTARCRQTAEALGLVAGIDPALADWDLGRWAGRTLAAVEADDPQAVAAWFSDPGATPHGGESTLDLIGRIGRWLDQRSTVAGHAIAITHSAVVRATIVGAIQSTPQSFWQIDIGPLTQVRLTCGHQRWRLRSIEPPN